MNCRCTECSKSQIKLWLRKCYQERRRIEFFMNTICGCLIAVISTQVHCANAQTRESSALLGCIETLVISPVQAHSRGEPLPAWLRASERRQRGRLTWITWLCWTVNDGDPVPVNLANLEVGTGSPCMGLCKTWERELVPDLGSGAETLGALRNCALLLTIMHVNRHQTEMQKFFKPSVGEEPYAFPCFE
jgi:hypothetical protein